MRTIFVSGNQPSSNAGEINIVLSDNHDATITIKGSHNTTMSIDEKLCLLAAGANGLDGIKGADGRDGAPGVDGNDANRFR